jgi:hypothetical protein
LAILLAALVARNDDTSNPEVAVDSTVDKAIFIISTLTVYEQATTSK